MLKIANLGYYKGHPSRVEPLYLQGESYVATSHPDTKQHGVVVQLSSFHNVILKEAVNQHHTGMHRGRLPLVMPG